MKEKIKQLPKRLNDLLEIPFSIVRARFTEIDRQRRQRAQRKQQAIINEAMGRIVGNLEPLFMRFINETLTDYHDHVEQNHYTIQAQHDIKKLFQQNIKNFISRKE